MQLSPEIITAPTDAIRDTGPHLFWSGEPDDALAHSIAELGQTTPLLARETDTGLDLIAGHGRLAVLRSLKQPALVRLVLNADEAAAGILYLTDNAMRPLDDGMRLTALRFFHPLLDEKTLHTDILPRLGVKPKSKDATLLLAWLRLPLNWQAHLAAGRVPLAAGTVLSRMNETDRAAVEPLFAGFSWSRSNAVNILTWLFETARMTNAPLVEVLHTGGMDAILGQGLSPKDAIVRLTSAARNARYPELSALQERFSAAARELAAKTKWRVIQPDNFETNGAELTIQVKDADQLARAVSDLQAMAGLPVWQEIWNLGGNHE